MHIQNTAKEAINMYKLEFLVVDFKKVITDKEHKMKDKIFRAYCFKKTFIQIFNFVPHVLNSCRPKKKETLTLKWRPRFLVFIWSILKRILFTPLLNRNFFILSIESDIERRFFNNHNVEYSILLLGFYLVPSRSIPHVCVLIFSSYCSPA